MNSVDVVDDLVREYLLFRGCAGALRAWELEVKADRDKGFQADRLVEQLFAAVSAYDLTSLTEQWAYLDARFFARLEDQHVRTVKRLELCLLRYYLVHAAQHARRDKILEFFDTLATDVVDSDDWAPWFALPFVRKPEADPYFEPFFGRQWLETFTLSLHNFLQTVFHSLPLPALLSFNADRLRIRALELEVEGLRRTLDAITSRATGGPEAIDVASSKRSAALGATGATSSVGSRPSSTADPVAGGGNGTGTGAPTSPTAGAGDTLAAELEKLNAPSPTVTVVAQTSSGTGTWLVQHTFTDHEAPVVLARFSPTGSLVASADADRTLRLWATPAGYGADGKAAAGAPTLVTTYKAQLPAEIASMHWDTKSERLLFLGTDTATVRAYNTEARSFVHEFVGDAAYPWYGLAGVDFGQAYPTGRHLLVGQLSCSPVEPMVVAASAMAVVGKGAAVREGVLAGWNLRSMGAKPLFTLTLASAGSDLLPVVRSLGFNMNGQLLATGDLQGVVRIVDLRTLTTVQSWQTRSPAILGVQFAVGETELRCIGTDGKLMQWSLRAPSEAPPTTEVALDGFQSYGAAAADRPAARHLGQAAFDPLGDHVICSSGRGFAPIYETSTGRWAGSLGSHQASASVVDWAPASASCLTASADKTVRLYRVRTGGAAV